MLIYKILTIEEIHIMFILPDRSSVSSGLDPPKVPHAEWMLLSSCPPISTHSDTVGVIVCYNEDFNIT